MNANLPRFSIGIPTYDRIAMVREAVASCKWQTFGDFEATIANDFVSQALTPEDLGVAGDPRFTVINREVNLGPLGNQNALMQAAAAPYFIWLSDDDMYMPDLLATAQKIIEKETPDCIFFGFVHGSSYPQGYATFGGEIQILTGLTFLERYFDGTCPSQPWYGVWRRDFIREIGGMRQMGRANFSPYSDLWLAIRAAAAKKLVYVPHPFVFFRTHETARSTVSVDLIAYTSGQAELLALSKDALLAAGASDAGRIQGKMMLRFISDYFEVLRRSGRTWSLTTLSFWRMIHRYLPADQLERQAVKVALNRELYRFFRERLDPLAKIVKRLLRRA